MGSVWHSFLYLGQPHFWERKLWGEICFLMLCWSSYLLSSQMDLATRSAGYRTIWLTPHHLSSAGCHLQQPPSHTCNYHHMYCYSTTACLLPLLLLFYSCQRLLRMTKSNRRKKVVGAEREPCWLAASSMCFCVFKISTRLLKEQHFYILQVILWKHLIKKWPC